MSVLIPILFIATFVALFGTLLVVVSSKLGPKPRQSEMRLSAYECGLPGQSSGNSKISVKFYLTAILFILFDIEVVFMFPWAIHFMDSINEGYGLQVLLAMGVFLLVFIVGLIWEIKSKALEWE